MNIPIGVRDLFRSGGGGGLMYLARIFSPALARKSSGFVRILLDIYIYIFFFFFFFFGGGGR